MSAQSKQPQVGVRGGQCAPLPVGPGYQIVLPQIDLRATNQPKQKIPRVREMRMRALFPISYRGRWSKLEEADIDAYEEKVKNREFRLMTDKNFALAVVYRGYYEAGKTIHGLARELHATRTTIVDRLQRLFNPANSLEQCRAMGYHLFYFYLVQTQEIFSKLMAQNKPVEAHRAVEKCVTLLAAMGFLPKAVQMKEIKHKLEMAPTTKGGDNLDARYQDLLKRTQKLGTILDGTGDGGNGTADKPGPT